MQASLCSCMRGSAYLGLCMQPISCTYTTCSYSTEQTHKPHLRDHGCTQHRGGAWQRQASDFVCRWRVPAEGVSTIRGSQKAHPDPLRAQGFGFRGWNFPFQASAVTCHREVPNCNGSMMPILPETTCVDCLLMLPRNRQTGAFIVSPGKEFWGFVFMQS